MTRTKLADRILPTYTKGEEICNMVTHTHTNFGKKTFKMQTPA